ncbi:MAG: hypothetical protein FJ214_01850 [Ignavibacteria bacterium]|nr:hypothetical protein [Ignavibacteria bacterium]
MRSNQSEKNIEQVKLGSTFFEFITVTVKYRWFLFWFVLLVTAGATIYALVAPKWFKATASVFPAERTDFLGSITGLSNLVKNFSPSRGLAALTGANESDKYIAILKSSSVIDDVISKFELKKVYDLEDEYYEKVYKEFVANLDLEVQDEGNLTIEVYDKDPKRAADIANYMIDKLNEINTRMSVVNAKANREFIEKRYLQNISDIGDLESGMKDFQEKYGVIAVPEQIEVTVKAMADIYAQLAEKEIELNVINRTYGESHPLAIKSKIEIDELKKKINKINAGNDESQKGVNLLIPFKKAPKLGYDYLKLYRNLEIQYKILEFVTPLYEQAKVEEVRNTPSVVILDKAYPPDRKAKPKGSIFALVSFVASTIIGFFLIFMKELFNKMKLAEPERYKFVFSQLRNDFRGLTFRKKESS